MSRVSLLAEVIRLKAGSQASRLSRKAVWLAGLSFLVALLLPALAAASCTKTWVGGAEGVWGEGANWSPAGVPASTDVTCIASGDTVSVTENGSQTGSLAVAGTLSIPSGSGRVTSQTDGNKHTITYVRNPVGEVTEIKDPSAVSQKRNTTRQATSQP